jgi:hypothetical protein
MDRSLLMLFYLARTKEKEKIHLMQLSFQQVIVVASKNGC